MTSNCILKNHGELMGESVVTPRSVFLIQHLILSVSDR